MRIVDLRSDTVTKPSPEMWEATKNMTNDRLGDDVEKDDPTVNELEQKAAKLLGKEAALFVTSGTQGNLVSLLSQTSPGDEILVEQQAHIYKWEVGGAARIGGLMVRTFPSNKGVFNPKDLTPIIRPHDDFHQPITKMICMENTHNYHGGIALPPELFAQARKFADDNQLKFHLDGARVFNAAVARNIPVTDYTKHVDSVQFCLSKGLSCPVGSIIAGSAEFIEKAVKFRKMLGGGWRQAGILASMGLIALEPKWIQRLEKDHKRARNLGKGIEETDLPIRVQTPETNLLMVEMPKQAKMDPIVQALNDNGILCHNMDQRIRFVTHFGITDEDIEYAVKKTHEILSIQLKNMK
ncbi:MAG: threonine aldolase family protein, partial [Promethearchaeota archaeon]